MRNSLVITAAAMAIVSAATFMPHRAHAGPLSAAAGLASAAHTGDVATQVSYACTRVWRCGPFGCGFRSVCGWRPGPYAFHGAWAHRPYGGHYGHYRGHYGGHHGWGGHRHWRGGW